MKKVFLICVLLFVTLSYAGAHDVHINSREEWGADESYTDVHSTHWQEIISKRQEYAKKNSGKVQQSSYASQREENRKRVAYVNKNYASRYALRSTQSYNDDVKLAWPIKKSKIVDGIIIHHTASEYIDTKTGLQNIHKFHSISRQWGDIGYNFIIGYDGNIYEGRLGGDYAIGAHATWNNYSTVAISMMGNYNEREMTPKQYTALQDLIEHLIYKYEISMFQKIPLHKTCKDCTHGLETEYFDPIAGHKDAGHTTCPGENIYKELGSINNKFKRQELALESKLEKISNLVAKIEDTRLSSLQQRISELQTQEMSSKNSFILHRLSKIIEGELNKS